MPFNQKPQKFNAKINTVTIGSGEKTVTFGGDSTFPFYTFEIIIIFICAMFYVAFL